MSDHMATTRIKRELSKMNRSNEHGELAYRVEIIGDTYSELTGKIAGPSGTPYEGGIFSLKIDVPKNYPFCPPKVQFMTNVWHPNISEIGTIDANILKDQWSPAMSLSNLFLSLQLLMTTPAENYCMGNVTAFKQYRCNKTLFNQTTEYWTSAYAGGPNKNIDFDEKVQRLVDMGTQCDNARKILAIVDWSLEAAILIVSKNLA